MALDVDLAVMSRWMRLILAPGAVYQRGLLPTLPILSSGLHMILNIISCSFLMLLAIEAGLIVGPEAPSCSTGGGSIVGAINVIW